MILFQETRTFIDLRLSITGSHFYTSGKVPKINKNSNFSTICKYLEPSLNMNNINHIIISYENDHRRLKAMLK